MAPPKISFWLRQCSNLPHHFYSSNNTLTWIKEMSIEQTTTSLFTKIPWSIIFLIIVWATWLARNKFVMEKTPFSPDNIFKRIQSLSIELYFDLPLQKIRPSTKLLSIGWKPPPLGFYKLNTDGSAKSNPGMVGVGGLIRDYTGHWIGGFSRNIGITHSLAAELWGLRVCLVGMKTRKMENRVENVAFYCLVEERK